MLHLRMISPRESTDRVVEALGANPAVCNIVVLPAAARRPEGDLVLCDVAREEASVVLADLRDLGLHHEGSIVVQDIETQLSDRMARATHSARGAPADAVVWEEVTHRTEESAELSVSFVMFMLLAGLIAAVGLFLDSSILIVGAMVVGPEFGPIAGLCVAMLTRRADVARRSARALVVGFVLAIAGVVVASWIFRATGATPDSFDTKDHELARIISRPDFFAFFVAFCAGIVGMLSLTTAKSSTLIGVFISITTIPSAANAGIGAAYGDWSTFVGSLGQLAINLSAIVVAGMLTLVVQRALYARRRREHLGAAGGGAAQHDPHEPPRDDREPAPAPTAARKAQRR
jgi:uncharacterized hydrophobic protein (TIGR00271 family)